ncbi:MAG TPA: glycosyltransferase [Chitinophagaceae bacterium]
MKIAHFTYNTTGGAGKVALQLHKLFLRNEIESALINTQTNFHGEYIYTIPPLERPFRKLVVKIRYYLFRIYARLRYKRKKSFAFYYNYNYRNLTFEEIKQALPFTPDIIFLHWISDFILPEHIKALYAYYKCPIIWRYNDLAPATGGCHYPGTCENYKTACGNCPAISSKKLNDHSNKHWKLKKRIIDGIPIIVINSTKETETAFKISPLFSDKRHEFIRNSLNRELFNDHFRNEAKRSLNIKDTTKVIFWGATYITEERKGFKYFLEALAELKKDQPEDILILIGGNKPDNFNPEIPYTHQYTGLLSSGRLASHYKAADAIVVSSLEDGGPMMIVESMMCGTPVVSFGTGLANELVIAKQTGYRAEKANSSDLKKGIQYILNLQQHEKEQMSNNCTQLAQQFYGEEKELKLYQDLFKELLQSKK